jgi:hypothetical protein
MSHSTFRRKISPHLLLVTCFMLISWFAYSSILTVETICSSETTVDYHRTAPHCIPKDVTLYSHRCEKLRSNLLVLLEKINIATWQRCWQETTAGIPAEKIKVK